MTTVAKKSIVIRNIYYMMAYAFRTLELKEYKKLETEEFQDADDLLAAILVIGISTQLKRGLERGYREVDDDITGIRGRLDLQETARHQIAGRQLTHCAFDEFDEDTYKNRILKRCAEVLLASSNVGAGRKRDLKRCLLYLRDVSSIDETRIEWNRLRYHRNNGSYQLLMNVCYMVLADEILTTDEGGHAIASFITDRDLFNLYEAFVLAYFRQHYAGQFKASAKVINQGPMPAILPTLNTDVTLEAPGGTLIIDCKFYGQILKSNYGHEALSPNNVNQIYMYSSTEAYHTHKHVEGMLLYAKTINEKLDSVSWQQNDIMLHARTLDLDCDFGELTAQLDAVAAMVMGM